MASHSGTQSERADHPSWGHWVATWAHQRWRTPDRRRTVQLLIDNEQGLATGALAWTIAASVTPILVLLAMGHLLSQLLARRGLVSAVLLLGGAYALSLSLNGLSTALGSIVKVRLTYDMKTRLMSAVSRPTGIAHLEDPAVFDQLALAQGSLISYFPADAPMFLCDGIASRFESSGSRWPCSLEMAESCALGLAYMGALMTEGMV
jgi:hypothetical protein